MLGARIENSSLIGNIIGLKWKFAEQSTINKIVSLNLKPYSMRKSFLWCKKHGLAFVGQVFDVKWRWFRKNWHTWGWRQEASDVDNNKIYNKVVGTLKTPYCNIFQILTAKWAAPGHFICSSSAWWCAKNACNVNIGDWWKPTIFPAGVYLSDRVRIIDNTLN